MRAWQLRDYALRTGELDRAIAFIKLKFHLGDAQAQHLDVCNDVDAVYLSELLAASGQPQQAVTLRAAASWYDANEAKYLGSRRLRARGSVARRQTGRGARGAGRIISLRLLRLLIVPHRPRPVVVAVAQ
jgi:hypothetical protein